MEVNLIAMTQPMADRSMPTTEDLVAFCARVSNPANQLNTGSANKLLQYLVKNKHWSPFEMVSLTMEIKTTRDIGRQILRHRSFSFQEFSQRYAVPPLEDFTTNREARLQDTKNRQNSIEVDDEDLQIKFNARQAGQLGKALENYKWALDNGIAKEQARIFLPEGMSPTHMYMSGSLRSWIHYCELRMGNGTQKEHREIATAIWGLITKEFPSLEGILNQ